MTTSFKKFLSEKKLEFKEFINKVIEFGASDYDKLPLDKKMKDEEIVKIVVQAAMKKDKDVKKFWMDNKDKNLVKKVAKALQL